MSPFFHRFYRAVLRVIPTCITQTQAIAFNIFLAFFPMLLLVLGIVASSPGFEQALQGMVVRLRPVLPPGTVSILSSFLSRHSTHPWQWVLLGTGGTLLAGTQMMELRILTVPGGSTGRKRTTIPCKACSKAEELATMPNTRSSIGKKARKMLNAIACVCVMQAGMTRSTAR